MPAPRPLYLLPELLAAPEEVRVFVTEGEKAADAARTLGLLATTSSHGAEAAAKSDWSLLKGRDVVVLPDNDAPGERYATGVVQLATAAGAKSVRIVRLKDLWNEMPDGGDVDDLLQQRGEALEKLRTDIEALVSESAPEVIDIERPQSLRFTPFPLHVLPVPIREFCTRSAKSIGCDPSMIIVPLLAAMGAAIGNTSRIELKPGWSEPSIIWAATVAHSGSHKTPAFNAALRLLRRAQDRAFEKFKAELAEWELRSKLYEVEIEAWKRVKGMSDQGKAVNPPEKPVRPTARRFLVSDITTEALAAILHDNQRGVLLARDELAGWISSFDRYAKTGRSSGDAATWLCMHSGEAMTIDRKTGAMPTIHVPSAFVCITGGIQPDILARVMKQEHRESGLLARMLFAMPPRCAKRWTDDCIDPETEALLDALFDRLLELGTESGSRPTSAPSSKTDHLIRRMDEEAKSAWIEFFNEHSRRLALLTGDEAAAEAKLEAYAARLALLLHEVRVAAEDNTLLDPTRIDRVSIAAGVEISLWFSNEMRRVYAFLSESEDERAARQLVDWIEQKGGAVTVRDLMRGPREFRGDAVRAEEALNKLVAAGFGRWESNAQSSKGGRPTAVFRLASYGRDVGDGDETSKNPVCS
ncbi:MAG: DUF3987 domain-containing protein [Phycisphaerales bacterium]